MQYARRITSHIPSKAPYILEPVEAYCLRINCYINGYPNQLTVQEICFNHREANQLKSWHH